MDSMQYLHCLCYHHIDLSCYHDDVDDDDNHDDDDVDDDNHYDGHD